MSDQQFITECERLLDQIEDALDGCDVDVDMQRTGHVLEIEFDDGATIVVNGQVPMQEIWLASPAGAHHFHKRTGRWTDTRSGEPLAQVLSRHASLRAGRDLLLAVG